MWNIQQWLEVNSGVPSNVENLTFVVSFIKMTAHRWPKSNSPSKIKLQLTSGQDEHETYRLSRKVCDFERPSNVMPQKWLLSFSSFQQKILKHFWEVISKIGNNLLVIPQFDIDPLSSTHQFITKATPFQHPKSVSWTPKTFQFNTPLSSTQKTFCSTPKNL